MISIIEGRGPVVLAAPHGARKLPLSAFRPSQLTVKHDLKTDLLAEELCGESASSEYPFSAVIARLHRAYVDLNREPAGSADRLAYARDYHQAIERLLDRSAAGWGFALLVDIHGCVNRTDRGGRGDNPRDNIIYLGTMYGRHVPEEFRSAYDHFRDGLKRAGYNVYPPEGFDEFPSFRGGYTVKSHFSRMSDGGKPCLAIQIEVPRAIRVRRTERREFATALAKAITDLVEDMIAVSPGDRQMN